jgi:SNF2 family DNA or RNA helicase
MVNVTQPRAGVIEVDFSEEPTFDMSTHGLDLTFGLTTRAIRPTSILLDDGGDPASVLRYVVKAIKSSGFQTSMEAALGASFEAMQQEAKQIEQIRSGKIKPIPFPKPTLLGITRHILPHQLDAIKRGLKSLNAANFSVPGSGKTTVALSTFAAMVAACKVQKLFVIGPASCFDPWTDEFNQVFSKQPTVLRLIGSKAERHNWVARVADSDLVLCTYQMAYREKDNFIHALKAHDALLVLDESHYVKNMNGAWATTILELAPFAKQRMILSGTPAPRSLRDLWTQFTFLWPSQALAGTKSTFEKTASSLSAPSRVRRLIQPFFVRTSKQDLGLPKPHTQSDKIPYAHIPHRQRTIIRLLEARTLAQIKAIKPAARDLELIKRWRKARVLRLMQAASNPMLLTTALPDFIDVDDATQENPILERAIATYGRAETPAKIAYVVDKAKHLVAAGKKVLIWAIFIENLRTLKRHLAAHGAEMIYGEVPAYMEDDDDTFPSRERIIKEFKKPESSTRILLANPAACAESISLHTVCHDAIYLERSFNCVQFLQSLDRIHRVGLKKTDKITYYLPLIDTAIERVIDTRLASRQGTLYEVLGDPARVVAGLDGDWLLDREEELEDIFHELEKELQKDAADHAGSP